MTPSPFVRWAARGVSVELCPLCCFRLERDATGGHLARCVADVASDKGGWLAFGLVGKAPEVPRRMRLEIRR